MFKTLTDNLTNLLTILKAFFTKAPPPAEASAPYKLEPTISNNVQSALADVADGYAAPVRPKRKPRVSKPRGQSTSKSAETRKSAPKD